MAYLVVKDLNGDLSHVVIYKRVTTIGPGLEFDIVLPHSKLLPNDAYIVQNDDNFLLYIKNDNSSFFASDRKPYPLQLKDKDSFQIDGYQLEFVNGKPPVIKEEVEENSAVIAYRKMLKFSENVAKERDIEILLKTLLSEIIEITRAEEGYLVLLEDGSPNIKVSKSNNKTSNRDIGSISDSIVKKVIETKKPMVISDAVNHGEFKSSQSVINYKLTSVMCSPLIYQGNPFGAIFVANNSFVNVFDNDSLELMLIFSSQAAMLLQNALHINALTHNAKRLQESLEFTKFGGVISGCPSMHAILMQVEKLAQSDIAVLISGETGTGKELIARELHQRSLRKNAAMVVVNCAEISEEMLERELFGYVRGAFAGALHTRSGKIQAAHQGTLVLSDVHELPFGLQVKLLNAFQEQKLAKIGDSKKEDFNVRVITTTTRDLSLQVKAREFRDDLYYCLNGVEITLPALRDRGNDVLVIANFLLQKYAKIYGKPIIGFMEEAQNALLNFHWPGNVRQLENRVRRAVVMCDYNRISLKDLDIAPETERIMTLSDALDKFRLNYIAASLERNAGNRTKAAEELGVDPRTVFRYLESRKKETAGI